MHAVSRLTLSLLGKGVGLAFRGACTVIEKVKGESDLEYLRRKHHEVVVRTWPID